MKKVAFNLNNKNGQLIIAIIGFGRFGQLLTKIFLNWSKAKIIIVSSKKHLQTNPRLSFIKLKEIVAADLIIPCVPISTFGDTIGKIAKILNNCAIVMDICSVKIFPVELMKKILPKNSQIIASHPMFGPDSIRINKNLKNLRLVMHNVSALKQNYLNIQDFFRQLGLNIIEMSPEKHDKLLAWSLGYSYLVGKIGQRLRITDSPIDTIDFQLLLQNLQIVANDSEELFIDLQTYNPFATEVQQKFIQMSQKVVNQINKTSKKLSIKV